MYALPSLQARIISVRDYWMVLSVCVGFSSEFSPLRTKGMIITAKRSRICEIWVEGNSSIGFDIH